MANRTAIEWTDATWNPLRGCSRVSAGCQHCYAERVAARFRGAGQPYEGLIHPTTHGWNGKVRFVPEALVQPLRWKRPRRIFVNSMSDLFHESVSNEVIAGIFGIMAEAPQHTFQVLTKRPGRARRWFSFMEPMAREMMHEAVKGAMGYHHPDRPAVNNAAWPLPNVWIGVSVENQATADERIPLLLQCPAAVRWLSCEPLLGPVDMVPNISMRVPNLQGTEETRAYNLPIGIDWVVAGGESGPGARPMHPDWARSLRDQCAAAGVSFLFKQWGEWLPISQQEEAFTNRLYRSNRKAALHEDQGALDDAYGRTCTVPYGVVHADGSFHAPLEPMAFLQGTDPMTTFRVGKKAAGRLLDGVEHNGYPEARP